MTLRSARMARRARVIVPGYPHHITQRGNRRQRTFFCDADHVAYLELMAKWCTQPGVEIGAYCLMPNHMHLIAVPATEAGPRLTGRPLGNERFVTRLEANLRRLLAPKRRGRKPKQAKK